MQVAVQQARRRRSHLQSTHAGSFCNDVVGSEETISSQLPDGTFPNLWPMEISGKMGEQTARLCNPLI